MAYNQFAAGDPWGGMANQGAPKQTYEEFLAELAKHPELLGADGTLQGSAIGGGPWDSWGKTPKQFYDEKMAEKVQSGFTGYGDSMEANMIDPSFVSLDRTEDTRGDGLRTGLGMMGAVLGAGQFMGGAGAAGGPGSAGWGMDLGGAGSSLGPAASAGGTSAFSFGTPSQVATGFDLGAVPTVAGGGGAIGSVGGGTAAAGSVGSGFGFPAELGGGMASGVPAWDAAATKAGLTLGTTASGGFLGDIGKFLKDNPTLAQLGGAALGALSAKDQNQTSTSTRDPWGPAQQYLKDNLATNAAMQKHYQANPFSTEQQGAYQGLLNTLANNQANGNVLLGNASKFGQSSRGQVPQMAGLLTGTQAPIIDWARYANIGLLGG